MMRALLAALAAPILLGVVATDTANLTTTDPVASNWPIVEQRCEALGAGCTLSEPLDEAAGAVTSDPANTEGVLAVEAATLDCAHAAATYAAVPEPLGTATNALHFDRTGGLGFSSCDMRFTTPLTFTDSTFAMRAYEYLDPSHDVPDGAFGTDEKIKWFRAHSGDSGPHPGFETSTENSCDGTNASTCGIAFDFLSFGNSTFRGASDLVATWSAPNGQPHMSDLLGEWVRIEVTFTHYPTGHPDVGKLGMRGRLHRLSDDKEWVTDLMVSPNAQATAQITSDGAGDANKAMLLDTPQITANRWASAIMNAVVAADDTFWIGPACEIEGCP